MDQTPATAMSLEALEKRIQEDAVTLKLWRENYEFDNPRVVQQMARDLEALKAKRDELYPNNSHALLGRVFEKASIDVMAEDLEMDSEDIAAELVACGYDEEEADRLSFRPWVTTLQREII